MSARSERVQDSVAREIETETARCMLSELQNETRGMRHD
jgi:hypothetical protein